MNFTFCNKLNEREKLYDQIYVLQGNLHHLFRFYMTVQI